MLKLEKKKGKSRVVGENSFENYTEENAVMTANVRTMALAYAHTLDLVTVYRQYCRA